MFWLLAKKRYLLIAFFCLGGWYVAPSYAYEPQAKAAWVYDITSDTILLEKNADIPLPPASMSKLMTLNMLFEALRDGRVALDDVFTVSAKASQIGGSTMFLQQGDRPTVHDLIRGIIVNSGNDACIVVAEGLAGSEEAFARQMTQHAHELGMSQTTLMNASGWPHPGHRMSLHDLGFLAGRLISEFPEYYSIFSNESFDYKGRAPANARNRNPLLGYGNGADGLKTGHTSEAGYGLVGSARQGERRVVFVISGLESDRQRAEEARRILDWSFRQFAYKTLVRGGDVVTQADVWGGAEDRVSLTPQADVRVLVPAPSPAQLQVDVFYEGPLTAPIPAGSVVAKMVIQVPGMADVEVPLVVARDVAKGGVAKRLLTAVKVLSGHRKKTAEPPAVELILR